MEYNCRNCEHEKSQYKDFVYCSVFGFTRSRPRVNCYGWEKRKEQEKREEKQVEKG